MINRNGSLLVNRRRLLVGLAAVTVATVAGGSNAAFAQSGAAAMTGCWPCGSWQSYCTGHHGNLHGSIVQCDATHFECHFAGSFAKVIPFRYSVVLTVTGEKDGVVYFQGQKYLGRLAGGNYYFNGWATANQFHAGYTADKDKGEFVMNR
jgi:hypothetical protein